MVSEAAQLLPRGHVPEPEDVRRYAIALARVSGWRILETGHRQGLAVRRERNAMRIRRLRNAADLLTGFHLPEADDPGAVAIFEQPAYNLAVRRSGQCPGSPGRPREALAFSSGGHLPEADRLIAAAGDEIAVPAREEDGQDALPPGRFSLVSQKTAHFLAGGRVPEADGIVLASGGEPFPVRRIGDVMHVLLMSREPAEQLARVRIPEVDRFARRARERSAIRRKREPLDSIFVPEPDRAEPAERTGRKRIAESVKPWCRALRSFRGGKQPACVLSLVLRSPRSQRPVGQDTAAASEGADGDEDGRDEL